MKVKATLGMMSVVAVLGAMPMTASAWTVAECRAMIDLTQTNLQMNEDAFLSRNSNKDYSGLNLKLDYARGKLDLGKNGDSMGKLQDFIDAVDSMIRAAKPKIVATVGYDLIDDATDAYNCIDSL